MPSDCKLTIFQTSFHVFVPVSLEVLYLNAALSFNRCFQDLDKKILIVHEGNEERLRETWTELKRLEEIQVECCFCTDLISVCTKETFLLIFLEMSSVSVQAQKLCSTIRSVLELHCTLHNI